ncbi:Unknown protein [Striga hermonthica]|uniref:Myb/SANT-like domain-containing protein n=1 Tax=Striga hermonthica TaxID=68872 RepID=A0A9N7RRI4_STRHE|nr:Unknown protein [Striga hermonthica]
MSSGANPSLPTSVPSFRLPENLLEKRDPHSESTGSVSVNSPEKRKKRRRKMSTSNDAGPSQHKQGEAKWPPENEAHFISLMLDQVILGKCIGQKFKQANWMEIQKKLNDICGPDYYYEITQITSKHDRLKQQWRRFFKLLNKDTRFGWDINSGKITGGDEVWARWITDNDMKKRVCVHYRELTTIFNGTTATGRGARASTQTPDGNGRRRRTNLATCSNYLFPNESNDEEMNTPDSDRTIRRRRGTNSTFDTTMNSITEASRIIQHNARPNPEKDQESLQQALKALESLPNVPMEVRKLAWKRFRDPWSLYTFLGLELEENRLALLQMWMDDDGK